ncbi:MAG TPA: DNA polymerase III subunit delta, partial [Candidatus Limisoma gallistercoris]|nr:DNA polymerase III subunit delta [Candidatus Limisoma gallistercoris]
MKFSDILGQETVKQRLRSMAESGRIPHALLLEGPEGVGKLAMARA